MPEPIHTLEQMPLPSQVIEIDQHVISDFGSLFKGQKE